MYVSDLLPVGLLPEVFKDFVGRSAAQVGAYQRCFKILERRPIDFLAEGNYFLDALAEVLARTCNRLLHAVKQARFLLFVQTAKKGLNHRAASIIAVLLRSWRLPSLRCQSDGSR